MAPVPERSSAGYSQTSRHRRGPLPIFRGSMRNHVVSAQTTTLLRLFIQPSRLLCHLGVQTRIRMRAVVVIQESVTVSGAPQVEGALRCYETMLHRCTQRLFPAAYCCQKYPWTSPYPFSTGTVALEATGSGLYAIHRISREHIPKCQWTSILDQKNTCSIWPIPSFDLTSHNILFWSRGGDGRH